MAERISSLLYIENAFWFQIVGMIAEYMPNLIVGDVRLDMDRFRFIVLNRTCQEGKLIIAMNNMKGSS